MHKETSLDSATRVLNSTKYIMIRLGQTWANMCCPSCYGYRNSSSIETRTRFIIRLDETSLVVRRSRRTTEDSSS